MHKQNPMYNSGYYTITFSDLFPTVDEFKENYDSNMFPETLNKLDLAYYLLMSRYMNSHISNISVEQAKLRFAATLFMYGPAWERNLDMQHRLRSMTDDELRTGATALYNYAQNPSTTGNTLQNVPVDVLNAQNATLYKKSPMDALQQLQELMYSDVTKPFLDRFDSLFIKVLPPSQTPFYVDYDEE